MTKKAETASAKRRSNFKTDENIFIQFTNLILIQMIKNKQN